MGSKLLTNERNSMKDLKKLLLLVGLAVAAMLPAQAADYVFMYDGGYLFCIFAF